jgi:hypothetical protein
MKLPTLDEFLTSDTRPSRSWVREPGFKSLYVRNTERYFGEVSVSSIDLANAEVIEPGKGTFTRLVLRLHNQYPNKYIFAENVQETRLARMLVERLGFIPSKELNCFYLPSKTKGEVHE